MEGMIGVTKKLMVVKSVRPELVIVVFIKLRKLVNQILALAAVVAGMEIRAKNSKYNFYK
jgi:hypothetical protein